jgi:hypothetical protein
MVSIEWLCGAQLIRSTWNLGIEGLQPISASHLSPVLQSQVRAFPRRKRLHISHSKLVFALTVIPL